MSDQSTSRYTLITGKYWIHYPDKPRQGPEPDGDTVSFEPDDPSLVARLHRWSGRPPRFNARGLIPVRYEGIDALETHFQGAHQNLQYANAARDENLRELGFTNVKFFDDLPNKVASVDENPLDGYVIANGIEANGRMLGLVYTGAPPAADGSNIFVDDAMLDSSVNMLLVRGGLAYVEPYDSMPISLVRRARDIVATARSGNMGMFAEENVTKTKSATLQGLSDIEPLIMWPKLFRRLVAFFAEGNSGLSQFDAWVRQDPVHRDDTLRLPDGEQGNMHDCYQIAGTGLSLRFNPEEVLITPDPAP